MQYKLLSTRNPAHNVDLVAKIRLIYEGGYAIIGKAKQMLPQAPGEPTSFYEHRLRYASFMPYFGQLVDYLVGCLFQSGLTVTPAADANDPNTLGELPDKDFYPLFARDADRKGTTFQQVMRDAATEALICGCSWIAVDMPPAVEAETRSEEDAKGGARGYCYLLPYEQVFDFCIDDDSGELSWAITGKRIGDRTDPNQPRDTVVERYTLWEKEPVSGTVSYRVFETEPFKPEKPPAGEAEIPEVDSGTTTFTAIPFVRLELPAGLWAGNKIAPLAEEHFRRRSDLVGAMARSLFEIPVVMLGPEIGAVGEGVSMASENPHRGNDPINQFKAQGYLVLGQNDKLEFSGPSGSAYEIADKQLHDLRDEIYRSVQAMALSMSNSAATSGRSGDSKREDRQATAVILSYLGTLTRELAVRVYRAISEARDEDVVWSAHGLDSFDMDDATELLNDATLLENINIPSKTFKAEYLTRLAVSNVPGASPETKVAIQDEIVAGVDEAEDLKAAMAEAMTKDDVDPDADPADEPDADGDEPPTKDAPPAKKPPPFAKPPVKAKAK